jgi:hypothetical protein
MTRSRSLRANRARRPHLEALEQRTLFSISSFVAAGTLAGGTVAVYDAASGDLLTTFHPFGNAYTGAISVATGDVDGDDAPEIIVSPLSQGSTPAIGVFNAAGTRITSFLAFDTSFKGGLSVAVGDLTEDGHDDIVAAAGPGGTPHVRVFNSDTGLIVRSFLAYDASFHGGVNVALGDVNDDGTLDIVTAARAGGAPHIKAFNGANQQLIGQFFAYQTSYTNGVQVAVGDTNGDGFADIITSTGAGQTPLVKVFSGNGFSVLHTANPFIGSTSGATLGVLDFDFNGQADILVANGRSNGLSLKILKGSDLSTLDTITAAATTSNGYYIAGWTELV